MTMEMRTVNMLAASAPRWERSGIDQDDATDSGSNGSQWGNLWNQ